MRLVLEFAGNEITLVETRPYFRDPTQWTRLPVARFRFNAASGTWSLDCPNLREKGGWRPYPVQPGHDLDKLIKALGQDTSGVFRGDPTGELRSGRYPPISPGRVIESNSAPPRPSERQSVSGRSTASAAVGSSLPSSGCVSGPCVRK